LVNDVEITPRDLFFQVSLPKGRRAERVALLSPGYMQDGRNWYGMAKWLNDRGYAVVLMDHQWQGLTQGHTAPGKMDRDFGVARDVAAGWSPGRRTSGWRTRCLRPRVACPS
jgi:hypothetical protein